MLEKGTFTPYDVPVRRVGRPRENWVNLAYKPMCMKKTGINEREYRAMPVTYQRKSSLSSPLGNYNTYEY